MFSRFEPSDELARAEALLCELQVGTLSESSIERQLAIAQAHALVSIAWSLERIDRYGLEPA
jgi:hypothetical protein